MQPFPAKWCYLLAPAAGAFAPFALAPYGWWPLGIISLLLLLACLQQARPKRGLLLGWLYGLGLYGAGVSWVYHSIHDYGYAAPPLAGGLTLLFVAGLALLFTASFGYTFARLFRGKCWGALLGFPALWVLFEWLRSWLLTGFPWLLSGYAHTDTALAYWAPVLGTYGISFIVALSASSLYLMLSQFRGQQLDRYFALYASLFMLPWLGALLLSQVSWTQPQGQPISVTLLQPNITQDVKWKPEQRNKTLNQLYMQTRLSLDSDLVIWPENAVPLLQDQAKPFLDEMDALTRQSGTTLITGIPWRLRDDNGDEILHNSITALGTGNGVYHKQKLVPFGEYVPLQSLLRGLINFFNLPMSTFRTGPAEQSPLIAQAHGEELTVSPFICYEIVYPDFVRDLAKHSDLLLTISDDSWFGTSAGPLQHLQMARMRALENGRYLMRGTNTGVTAIIDHHGQITARAKSFMKENLSGDVWTVSGRTPFSHTGSWPVLLLCATLVAICLRSPARLYAESKPGKA